MIHLAGPLENMLLSPQSIVTAFGFAFLHFRVDKDQGLG